MKKRKSEEGMEWKRWIEAEREEGGGKKRRDNLHWSTEGSIQLLSIVTTSVETAILSECNTPLNIHNMRFVNYF